MLTFCTFFIFIHTKTFLSRQCDKGLRIIGSSFVFYFRTSDFQEDIHVRRWIFKCHMIHDTCSSWPCVCPVIERYSTKLRWTPGSASPVSTPIFILGLLGGTAVAPVLVVMAFIMALLPMFDPWLAVLVVSVPGAQTWVGWRVPVPHLPLSPAVHTVLECQMRWQSYSKTVKRNLYR